MNRNGGQTALHLAVYYGQTEMAKFLVGKLYADVRKTMKTGRTVFHIAARQGQIDTFKFLVGMFKDFQYVIDIDKPMNDGSTALHLAAH